MMTTAEEALTLRLAADLTTVEAARLAGVSKSYVSHVERGRPGEHATRYLTILRGYLTTCPTVEPYAVTVGADTVWVYAVSRPAALRAAAAIPDPVWASANTVIGATS